VGEGDPHSGRTVADVYRHAVTDRLALPPWPNVIGKRCLDVESLDGRVADELKRRGAGDVLRIDVADFDPAALDGRYDIAACVGLTPRHRDPVTILQAIRPLVDVLLLSVEPIDPVLSLLGRGRSLYALDADGFHASGGGHRQLVLSAGFVIERVSKPMLLDVDGPPPGRLGRLATRLLAGEGSGVLHRAILARPA
jgi:hypothetical protein